MKKPRIVPKRILITSDTEEEINKAIVFLQKWQQGLDDRLFREGYVLRDGVFYDRESNMQIPVDEYWKRKKHGR